ncbi:MAG: chemotaxis protein CheA [Alphaproteobacteria bacterium]|nr:chemotaxis protein CheA [Alphaproteobacteria bacterium]
MNIDMSQFQDTFLQEATENLEELEQGLLALESGDSADMDSIFRAAHSIKGGAGTFGFMPISDFTHTVESVLQMARDGDLEMTEDLVTALLASCDLISEMIALAKSGGDTAEVQTKDCLATLQKYENSEIPPSSDSNIESSVDTSPFDDGGAGLFLDDEWLVTFKPKPHLPLTGSDPINILRELKTLGIAKTIIHTEAVPTIDKIYPEELYFWWEINLTTDANQSEIQDIFMFVEDDADITVEKIEPKPQAQVKAAPKAKEEQKEEPVATLMDERREGEDRRKKTERRQAAAAPEQQYIRVAIDKVDNLINLVGELVTTNAMVDQHASKEEHNEDNQQQLVTALQEMSMHTRNLQESIMAIRMMPVDFAFSRFPRMVRDTANKLGKKVNLVTDGGNTELDKTVIEKISDPLTHLVRNSVDHGIESPEERAAAGKPEEGTVTLSAFYKGGSVMITITDDGKGLDKDKIIAKAIENGVITSAEGMSDTDIFNMIFASGFSTAEVVTDVSGRGVGMDVVRKNIQSLGGSVFIKSEPGQGSVFSISLPLTLAIVDAMATKVGDDIYMVPLLSIVESIRPTEDMIRKMQGSVEVLDVRGEFLPLLRLGEAMKAPETKYEGDATQAIAVIVESENEKLALVVDDLLGERQVVIKSIEKNYQSVEGISGATILGDGSVALIIDLPGVIKLSKREGRFCTITEENPPQDVTQTKTSAVTEDIS